VNGCSRLNAHHRGLEAEGLELLHVLLPVLCAVVRHKEDPLPHFSEPAETSIFYMYLTSGYSCLKSELKFTKINSITSPKIGTIRIHVIEAGLLVIHINFSQIRIKRFEVNADPDPEALKVTQTVFKVLIDIFTVQVTVYFYKDSDPDPITQ